MKKSISKDEDNNDKNNINENNKEKINKRKIRGSKRRNDSKSINIEDSIHKLKKVKFNNNIDVIDVECWKAYNFEQTADENFDAFFFEDNDDKNKKDNNNQDDKKKKNREEISCTCKII